MKLLLVLKLRVIEKIQNHLNLRMEDDDKNLLHIKKKIFNSKITYVI